MQFETGVSCICKRCSPILCPLTNSAKQQLYVCLSSIAGLKSFVQLRPPFVFVLVILQRHSSTIFLVFLRWSSTKLQNTRIEKSARCLHIIVFFRFIYIVWTWIQLFESFEESQRWRKPNLIFDKSLRVIEPENCAMSSFLCRKLFHRTDFKVQL